MNNFMDNQYQLLVFQRSLESDQMENKFEFEGGIYIIEINSLHQYYEIKDWVKEYYCDMILFEMHLNDIFHVKFRIEEAALAFKLTWL